MDGSALVRQVASEKQSRQFEAEVSETNIKMAELERELRDVTAHRNRLQLELNDASSRLQTAENQLSQMQRAKTALANQLDELRQAVDESSAVHTKVLYVMTEFSSVEIIGVRIEVGSSDVLSVT